VFFQKRTWGCGILKPVDDDEIFRREMLERQKRLAVASSLTAAEEVVNSPQRSTLAELFV